MKKAAVVLILLAVVSVVFGGAYQAIIGNAAQAAVVSPEAANFGYDNTHQLDVTVSNQSVNLSAFEVFNRFPLNAILTAQPSVTDSGLVITPVSVDVVTPCGGTGLGHDVITSFKGVTAGTYTVTWLVTAQIGLPGSGVDVELSFTTTVIVHDADEDVAAVING